MTTENKPIETDEIDLIEVVKKIWAGRKIIYKSMAMCFVLGLIVALGSPKEYKAEVTLLVETSNNSGGMSGLLQQFGGLAGINMSGSSSPDALQPDLYPDVIKSTPFLMEVMQQKVTETKYDSTLTVSQYLSNHIKSSLLSKIIGIVMDYTIGLPGKIIGAIRGKPKEDSPLLAKNKTHPLKLTQKQSSLINSLAGRIKAKNGESDNTLIISVEMQDPLVAAQLTDSVVTSLTKYITEYRTHKAKNDLKFVANSHAEAEAKYKRAQEALAYYSDQNKNVILASARSQEQRLQAEYNLAFGVYNTLSQQLEQSKFKVQQETPVFKVINPAMVPLRKSKPSTSLILMGMLFLGGFVGVGIIFGKTLYKNLNTSKLF